MGGVLHILPETAQRLPSGYELEAGGGNVGERQKQERDHEQINDERLKRDGAALIRHERTFMAAPSRTSFEAASRRLRTRTQASGPGSHGQVHHNHRIVNKRAMATHQT